MPGKKTVEPEFEITIEYMRPSELKPHPHNFRKHPKKQRVALKRSLAEFGFVVPIVVNKRTGFMLDGHLREEVVSDSDDKIPVSVVDWDELKEKKFLAAFDRIGELAEPDQSDLAKLMKTITDEDESTIPIGYEETEVNKLLKLVEDDDASKKLKIAGKEEPEVSKTQTTEDEEYMTIRFVLEGPKAREVLERMRAVKREEKHDSLGSVLYALIIGRNGEPE